MHSRHRGSKLHMIPDQVRVTFATQGELHDFESINVKAYRMYCVFGLYGHINGHINFQLISYAVSLLTEKAIR